MKQVFYDLVYYKKLYQYVFVVGKINKVMVMDMVCVMWEMFFDVGIGYEWKIVNVNWLELWLEYLQEKFYVLLLNFDVVEEGKWICIVSKDLWNQILVFVNKMFEDEFFGFWFEE